MQNRGWLNRLYTSSNAIIYSPQRTKPDTKDLKKKEKKNKGGHIYFQKS